MAMEHGTISGYGTGCRCTKCRAAWAAYIRARRRRAGGRTRAQFFADRRRQHLAAKQPEAEPQAQAGFADKTEMTSVMLTRLGKRLLDEARRVTGKTAGEVVERLLRQRLPHDLLDNGGGQ